MELYVTVDLGHLSELSEGQEVKVAGMKQTMREISTRRGDRMAFLTLEDLAGSAEVIVFSDPFTEAGPILGSEGPFIVQGTVDVKIRPQPTMKRLGMAGSAMEQRKRQTVSNPAFCIPARIPRASSLTMS